MSDPCLLQGGLLHKQMLDIVPLAWGDVIQEQHEIRALILISPRGCAEVGDTRPEQVAGIVGVVFGV